MILSTEEEVEEEYGKGGGKKTEKYKKDKEENKKAWETDTKKKKRDEKEEGNAWKIAEIQFKDPSGSQLNVQKRCSNETVQQLIKYPQMVLPQISKLSITPKKLQITLFQR